MRKSTVASQHTSFLTAAYETLSSYNVFSALAVALVLLVVVNVISMGLRMGSNKGNSSGNEASLSRDVSGSSGVGMTIRSPAEILLTQLNVVLRAETSDNDNNSGSSGAPTSSSSSNTQYIEDWRPRGEPSMDESLHVSPKKIPQSLTFGTIHETLEQPEFEGDGSLQI